MAIDSGIIANGFDVVQQVCGHLYRVIVISIICLCEITSAYQKPQTPSQTRPVECEEEREYAHVGNRLQDTRPIVEKLIALATDACSVDYLLRTNESFYYYVCELRHV